MLNKIDHIGIAVKSVEKAAQKFRHYFEIDPTPPEVVESQGVKVQMFPVGQSMIELLEPIREDSPIAKFIQKRGEGIHHVAFGVENIAQKLSCLKGKGAQLIHEQPIDGAHHKLIAFLNPKDTHSVLIELCERS